jgi:hypothetical protein
MTGRALARRVGEYVLAHAVRDVISGA